LTVDVTPRRLQAFPKKAGMRVFWQNLPSAGGRAIQQGTRAADGYGLITVTNVIISPSGNRLRIVTDEGPDSNSNGIPDYWEQAYFGGPTSAPAEGDADGDRVDNLDEYLAGTDPLEASSRFVISLVESNRLEWSAIPGFQYLLEGSTNCLTWSRLAAVTSSANRTEAIIQNQPDAVRVFRVRSVSD
jgi:hypothetical protein